MFYKIENQWIKLNSIDRVEQDKNGCLTVYKRGKAPLYINKKDASDFIEALESIGRKIKVTKTKSIL